MKARILGIGLLAACSSGDPCQVNGDCAAGESCSAEHTCAVDEPGPSLDAGGESIQTCMPNHDGVIERDEIVILVPGSANFRISGETEVDLEGTKDASGTRQWNLAGALTGDADVPVTTAPLAGTWFAGEFPDGGFTTPLTGEYASDLLGIYAVASDKVQILGAASKDSGITQTELTYDPPLDALAFPLREGQSWEGESTVTGMASGVYSTFTDAWKQEVDAHGELTTPYGSFPVLRVRLALSRTIGLYTTTTTAYAFVAECFGTVATVTSRANESADEFTTAAEVRRLAP